MAGMNGISADTTIELMIFTAETGGTQTVILGEVMQAGEYQLVLVAKEPGGCHGFNYHQS